MANIESIRELALCAVRHTMPANSEFTFENTDVNKALHDQFVALGGSINAFMRNRYDIYDIIIEAVDEVVPNEVIQQLGQFAEVQVKGEGEKALFKKKVGKNRAKKFLTQVGLSGVYETFRLDATTYTVPVSAIGGGMQIDFQRMLDGADIMGDLTEVITQGLVDAVYLEVQKALQASASSARRPSNNVKSVSGFAASSMVALVNTVKAYGSEAVIFATPDFIASMGPDAIVAPIAGTSTNYGGVPGVYAPADIDDIHNIGRIRLFRGTPVIEMRQSYVDESNTKVWLNDQYAYVLPTGTSKIVKVVLEGPTQMIDHVNRDNSIEIDAWKKFGVAIECEHNWGIYRNTSLTNNSQNPYGV